MSQFLQQLFDSSDFMPRWSCGEWTPALMWLHILSDFAIWFSYISIPLVLVYFVWRRRDVPFHWVFLMFGLFIVSCGFTHFMDMLAFKWPLYRLAGLIKLITALASLATVVSLIKITPRALTLPGLHKLNQELKEENRERRKAEEEVGRLNRDLKRRVDELEALLETIPIGIAVAQDAECRMIRANPACAELLRIAPGANASLNGPDAARLPFRVFQNEQEMPAQDLPMPAAVASRVAQRNVEVDLRFQDGQQRKLLISASPLFDEEGRARGCIGAFVDISERHRLIEEQRALEAKVLHAQKLESLGVLAGGIAHDFNNLLVGVLGNANLALSQLPAESPAREFLEKIERAAQRAANLTRQMLAYSGKGRFVTVRIDLIRLAEEMVHLLDASISKKAVLKRDYAPVLPVIEGDPGQISQVIMNLIINASEALGDKTGLITLRIGGVDATREYLAEFPMLEEALPGSYAFLEVSDTGCGMSKETMQKLFDPFFTTKFTGRGLGLSAVLGIVRAHRGSIRVYSEPERGSTFKVLFPALTEDAPDGSAASMEPAARGGKPGDTTVLVIDDEDVVRQVAQTVLLNGGYRVLAARDGEEGLSVFREHAREIDAVLLDMTMPKLGGQETFRELRRIRPDVRVVLTSGYNEQEAISRFVGRGLAGFLQKPFGANELLNKIAEALKPATKSEKES